MRPNICLSCVNKNDCQSHDYHNEIAKNCYRNPKLKDHYKFADNVQSYAQI